MKNRDKLWIMGMLSSILTLVAYSINQQDNLLIIAVCLTIGSHLLFNWSIVSGNE